MSKRIEIHLSKSLKLTNCLLLEISKEEDFEKIDNLELTVQQMNLHVQQRGAKLIGPLIQKTETKVDDDGMPHMFITLIRQADTHIHHADPPYQTESIIREPDCLYSRFIGEDSDVQHAYNKLHLVGYEEEIPLRGAIYTVFVDQNEEDGTGTVDIFMPKKN